jgi:serine protease Do
VQRAYLGVLPQEVDQAMATYYGLESPKGVLVAQVTDDTPAQKAGLRDGDIILSVDEKEIKNPSNLRNTISLSEVGQKVKLKIFRDGKEKDLSVKLEAFPDGPQTAAAGPAHGEDQDETLEGVTLRELNTRTRAMVELPEEIEGLLVTGVEQTSNAAEQGLAEGDVIIEVANQKVTSFKEFQAGLKINSDRPVFLKVYKPRQQRSIYLAIPR